LCFVVIVIVIVTVVGHVWSTGSHKKSKFYEMALCHLENNTICFKLA